ncbi:uncharacterized protein LOC131617797 [Vicia villosa]|uniref:uncharacterized protein LOC131617797 n=1 Tax=Vicia villosa TaxID=3911 RepID=UPI00273C525E|nr:uncharacterized protein LOC131617797 [Vicia villosa]
MESPQSVVSPLKISVMEDAEKYKSDVLTKTSSPLSKDIEVNRKEALAMSNHDDEFVGVVDVYIHQARDIHNICIYHKQDVYAKICLTSDPENSVSTKIINGGGRNPVFNDNLRLSVRTVESSLKCEIWMLSRVTNYLEDQLLGFALVPLCEILMKDGKLEKEFSLSSTDLFHSPAGFVRLSLSYAGVSPDVMVVSSRPNVELDKNRTENDLEIRESFVRDLDKIEFPDPKIASEYHLMVSEYFGADTLATSDTESLGSERGVQFVESLSASSFESNQPAKAESNGVFSLSPSASSNEREKCVDVKDGERDSSNTLLNESFQKPVASVNIEPEPKMVQQDIVDMYMKSMQQFTESLAKMKLPMDFENGPTSSGNSSSQRNLQSSKSSNSRVFYGSRAFF